MDIGKFCEEKYFFGGKTNYFVFLFRREKGKEIKEGEEGIIFLQQW